MIVYANALRQIMRHYGITHAEATARFGLRLVHVQCNVVTLESLAAVLADGAS